MVKGAIIHSKEAPKLVRPRRGYSYLGIRVIRIMKCRVRIVIVSVVVGFFLQTRLIVVGFIFEYNHYYYHHPY